MTRKIIIFMFCIVVTFIMIHVYSVEPQERTTNKVCDKLLIRDANDTRYG